MGAWLRDHIKNFVIPALYTLKEGSNAIASDIKPFGGRIRPSKKCEHTEAGMVLSALSSFGMLTLPLKNNILTFTYNNKEFHKIT